MPSCITERCFVKASPGNILDRRSLSSVTMDDDQTSYTNLRTPPFRRRSEIGALGNRFRMLASTRAELSYFERGKSAMPYESMEPRCYLKISTYTNTITPSLMPAVHHASVSRYVRTVFMPRIILRLKSKQTTPVPTKGNVSESCGGRDPNPISCPRSPTPRGTLSPQTCHYWNPHRARSAES